VKYRITLLVETEIEVEVEAPSPGAAVDQAQERFLRNPVAHIAGGFCSDWAVVGGRGRVVHLD
jgi:hypothetical protein